MTTSVCACNEKADRAIEVMKCCVVGTGLPSHVNWTLFASTMGAGVAAIGKCYGFKLTNEEGRELIKQFVLCAGSFFICMHVGSKMLAALIGSTYIPNVTMDVSTSAAFAGEIGTTSKEYFQREYLGKSKLSKEELGEIFREAFKNHKN